MPHCSAPDPWLKNLARKLPDYGENRNIECRATAAHNYSITNAMLLTNKLRNMKQHIKLQDELALVKKHKNQI